ncbi:hypothetical protein BJ875DRAFT_448718 [Amylocarpus encephaloides]|uniref:Uncharacterized protein n=1 Tax=Amylocarpus encephaloides TaxID=45428 RepID=A0A9P8CA78_9HELO|nr:hypothetical protein BJ875DRAFT_448718 [Amylocarpus encephaloides]
MLNAYEQPYVFPYPGFEGRAPQNIDPEKFTLPPLLPPLQLPATEWTESLADFLVPLSIVRFDVTGLSESADELLYGQYHRKGVQFPIEKMEFVAADAENVTVLMPMEGVNDSGTDTDETDTKPVASFGDMRTEDQRNQDVRCVPRISMTSAPASMQKNLTSIEENDLRRTLMLWTNPSAFWKYIHRQRHLRCPRGLRPRRPIHAKIRERCLQNEPGYKRWRVYRHSPLANELKVISVDCFGKTARFLKAKKWDHDPPMGAQSRNASCQGETKRCWAEAA